MRNHHTLRLHTKFITTHAKNKTFQHNQFHTSISRLVECFEIITKLKSNKMNRNMKSWTRSEYARSRIASRDFFFLKERKKLGKKKEMRIERRKRVNTIFRARKAWRDLRQRMAAMDARVGASEFLASFGGRIGGRRRGRIDGGLSQWLWVRPN